MLDFDGPKAVDLRTQEQVFSAFLVMLHVAFPSAGVFCFAPCVEIFKLCLKLLDAGINFLKLQILDLIKLAQDLASSIAETAKFNVSSLLPTSAKTVMEFPTCHQEATVVFGKTPLDHLSLSDATEL